MPLGGKKKNHKTNKNQTHHFGRWQELLSSRNSQSHLAAKTHSLFLKQEISQDTQNPVEHQRLYGTWLDNNHMWNEEERISEDNLEVEAGAVLRA